MGSRARASLENYYEVPTNHTLHLTILKLEMEVALDDLAGT
jgi:hypothetical protein